ncbi:ATP synthase F(0) complex subunit e, mitochondrial [Vipera latastei]
MLKRKLVADFPWDSSEAHSECSSIKKKIHSSVIFHFLSLTFLSGFASSTLLRQERACVLNGLVRHIRFSFGREEKMIAPVEVSPLIKLCRYSFLLLGIIYGARRYAYLKPIAAEDRRIEAEERAKQEELKRIAKALEDAQESILK